MDILIKCACLLIKISVTYFTSNGLEMGLLQIYFSILVEYFQVSSQVLTAYYHSLFLL